MKTKSIAIVGVVTALILSVPLIAMQFTTEVNWSPSDFIIMGILVFSTGLLIDLSWRKLGKYKVVSILVVLFLFLWLWAELAVGVFTNWGS
jgi:hypothetical protein